MLVTDSDHSVQTRMLKNRADKKCNKGSKEQSLDSNRDLTQNLSSHSLVCEHYVYRLTY